MQRQLQYGVKLKRRSVFLLSLAFAHPNELDMVKRKSAVSAEVTPAPTPFAEVGADSPPPALQPQPVSHLSEALLYASFLQVGYIILLDAEMS